MSYDVSCPADALSAVLSDLQARGAQIGQVDPGLRDAHVVGRVLLRQVLGYTTRLRSVTRGLGIVSLAPVGFQAAPPRD